MADIVTIENKINELDPSLFQRLCDNVMIFRGAKNFCSVGNVTGKRKTKKGTPDSFYFDEINSSYVFCEYTMQLDNIVKKFASDVQKCLQEANKRNITLSEIVFIYSTNDLQLSDEKTIRDLCSSKNIKLTVIGVTELAQIVNKNKYLLQAFFSIDERNRSILSLDEFVDENSAYSVSNMSYSFIGREKETNEIVDAINKNKYVFVSGDSGCGKSRLVVEALQRTNKRVLCVNKFYAKGINNLLDDLDQDIEFILFVDDINQLTYIKDVVDALKIKRFSKTRLVGTVRNYALQSIVNLFDDDGFRVVQIGAMPSDEIRELVKINLGITNPSFLDRIVEIANGNVRIAILAGEESLNHGLKSLFNSESLLSTYYKHRVAERFGDKYSNYIRVLFFVSFIGRVDLENLSNYRKLLSFIEIDEDDVKLKSFDLEKLEILKIISNRIVNVDDQCLSNYVVYDSFIASRIVDLGSFVRTLFNEYKSQIVDALNMISKVYTSKESIEYVKSEIVGIWNYFKEQGGKSYENFVSVFASLNEEESICYCREMLFNSGNYSQIASFEEFEKPVYGGNPYISILENIETAVSIHYLFKALMYVPVRNCAYASLERILTVKADDFNYGFSRFSPIIEEIKNTDGLLFYNILTLCASKILDFNFSYTSYSSKNQYIHYSFSLKDENKTIVPLRHQIWDLALLLSDDEKYKFMANFFNHYPSKDAKEIYQGDLQDAENVLKSINNKQRLKDIYICLRLKKHLKRTGLTWSPLKTKYNKEISFLMIVFRLLKDKYEYEEEEYSKSLNHYVDDCTQKSFEEDVKLLASFIKIDSNESYKVYDFLTIVINKLDEERLLPFIETVLSYDSLINKQVLAISAGRIIELNGNHFKIIETIKCNYKNELLLCYFEKRVEKQMIDASLKEKFKVFVENMIKENINCFDGIRPNVIWTLLNSTDVVNLISFIFEYTKNNKKVLPWTLDLLFNPYSEPNRSDIFKTFIESGRLNTLFDVFAYYLSRENNPYGASEYTFAFADINVEYLRKTANLISKNDHYYECYAFKGLWNQDKYKEYSLIIFDEFVKEQKYLFLKAHCLKHILDLDSPSETYQDLFIDVAEDLYVLYSNNTDVQNLVVELINETNDETRISFVVFLINHGLTVDEFSKYNFFSSMESFSNSYVPVINNKIMFLEKLRNEINKDPELIEYSRFLTSLINSYIKYKEDIKIKEALDGVL